MRKRFLLLMLVILLSLSVAWMVTAAPHSLAVDWWTIDGGGGVLTGGDYALSGTTGQFDAGSASGGSYGLTGGFWGDYGSVTDSMSFLPAVLK